MVEDNWRPDFHLDGHRALTTPFRNKNVFNKSKQKKYSRMVLLLIHYTTGRSSVLDLPVPPPPRASLCTRSILQFTSQGPWTPVGRSKSYQIQVILAGRHAANFLDRTGASAFIFKACPPASRGGWKDCFSQKLANCFRS